MLENWRHQSPPPSLRKHIWGGRQGGRETTRRPPLRCTRITLLRDMRMRHTPTPPECLAILPPTDTAGFEPALIEERTYMLSHFYQVEPIDSMGPLLSPVWVESHHQSTVLLSLAASKGITEVPGQPPPTTKGHRTRQTCGRPKPQTSPGLDDKKS